MRLLCLTHFPSALFLTDQVEAKCLEGLHWRLGPYFAEDVLDGEGDF